MPSADPLAIQRALLSVSDKTGIVELAKVLAEAGIELISTGGTAQALRDAGLEVCEVAGITGFPEIMGGRVKTLHPKIHGGLLARGATDAEVCAQHGIAPIDLLVVNLYPFVQTIAAPECSRRDAVENIDIGGPAMLRAAAKNHDHCCVAVDPSDYARVAEKLQADGSIDHAMRFELAAKAFAHTAAYDACIADYLAQELEPDRPLPRDMRTTLSCRNLLRYGENPHQQAALYRFPGAPNGTLATATLHQGQELSYNNLADADAALEAVRAFKEPACVIVKHANPCGAAQAADSDDAYENAYRTDPTSAFGGIIAFNRMVEAPLAKKVIERQFVEVLIAPNYQPEALQTLAAKPKVRVLAVGNPAPAGRCLQVRSISGGLLAQTPDDALLEAGQLRVATARAPSDAERRDLLFAWTVAKFVKSNAIVYARDGRTLGIGAGQMSRIYSARIAAIKAADEALALESAVMASDAFFPFRDGLDAAHEAGISAVIQPGGSRNDDEVIAAANEHGMAMLFTGMRHFRH